MVSIVIVLCPLEFNHHPLTPRHKIRDMKKVKAYTIIEGDTIDCGRNIQNVVSKVSGVGKDGLRFNYANDKGFGLYARRSIVNKIIK